MVAVGIFRKGMSRARLTSEGAPADAEILDIRYTNTRDTHGPVFAVKLAVRPPSGSAFEVDGKINASIPNPPRPGQVIPIRYDPDHPSSLIWDEEAGEQQHEEAVEARRQAAFGSPAGGDGGAITGGAETTVTDVGIVNASGADSATVLEKLARLRDQGLITDQQFQAARGQIETAGAPDASQPSGVVERLERLEQLRQQQLVTDDEYASQRKRILDSI